jgi:hypothetical protein
MEARQVFEKGRAIRHRSGSDGKADYRDVNFKLGHCHLFDKLARKAKICHSNRSGAGADVGLGLRSSFRPELQVKTTR